MTDRRQVRVAQAFFDRLDELLAEERGVDGAPSSADFLLHDIPAVIDRLAETYESSTVPIAAGVRDSGAHHIWPPRRVHGCLRRLAGDGAIEIICLEIGATASAACRSNTRPPNASSRPLRLDLPQSVLNLRTRPALPLICGRALARCDEVPLDGVVARAAGSLCGQTATADVIDASVVITATGIARHDDVAIITSDPDDMRRLLSVLDVRERRKPRCGFVGRNGRRLCHLESPGRRPRAGSVGRVARPYPPPHARHRECARGVRRG